MPPTFELYEITVDCQDPSVVGAFWSALPVVVMADPEGNEFCLVQHV